VPAERRLTPHQAAEAVKLIRKRLKRLTDPAATGSGTVLSSAFEHLAREKVGAPGGRAYDSSGGGRIEIWCWEHERPVAACHKAKVEPPLLCDGEPIKIADPVGEAALAGDLATADEVTIIRNVMVAAAALDRAAAAVERWTSTAGSVVHLAQDKADPGCQSCSRITGPGGGAYWSPTHSTGDTLGKGEDQVTLDRPMRL
jgi:hypothetical protein